MIALHHPSRGNFAIKLPLTLGSASENQHPATKCFSQPKRRSHRTTAFLKCHDHSTNDTVSLTGGCS
jgi:hypothetical protein